MNKWAAMIQEGKPKAWDKEQAFRIWDNVLERMSLEYKPGCLPWIQKHHPAMCEAITEAESRYSAAYERSNLEGVRMAAEMLETALASAMAAHKQACIDDPVLDASTLFKADLLNESDCIF